MVLSLAMCLGACARRRKKSAACLSVSERERERENERRGTPNVRPARPPLPLVCKERIERALPLRGGHHVCALPADWVTEKGERSGLGGVQPPPPPSSRRGRGMRKKRENPLFLIIYVSLFTSSHILSPSVMGVRVDVGVRLCGCGGRPR